MTFHRLSIDETIIASLIAYCTDISLSKIFEMLDRKTQFQVLEDVSTPLSNYPGITKSSFTFIYPLTRFIVKNNRGCIVTPAKTKYEKSETLNHINNILMPFKDVIPFTIDTITTPGTGRLDTRTHLMFKLTRGNTTNKELENLKSLMLLYGKRK